jgi:V/A-type H+/Na+-transporting ATPase subunit K
MVWLITLMTLSLVGLIGTGIYLEFRPPERGARVTRWFKGTVGVNLLVFVGAQAALVLLGLQDVMAQPETAEPVREISVGTGLALIGIGLPTGLAAIAAGIAVGTVGAASLAAVTEKPELFGRTLVYMGLAEGIAIYGLVVTILMLGKA